MHYVEGLKYILLSISHIWDRGNEVKFMTKKCFVRNSTTKRVVMFVPRVKNMYVVYLDSIEGDDLSYLGYQTIDYNIWHKHLGPVSSSLLTKLLQRTWSTIFLD